MQVNLQMPVNVLHVEVTLFHSDIRVDLGSATAGILLEQQSNSRGVFGCSMFDKVKFEMIIFTSIGTCLYC